MAVFGYVPCTSPRMQMCIHSLRLCSFPYTRVQNLDMFDKNTSDSVFLYVLIIVLK